MPEGWKPNDAHRAKAAKLGVSLAGEEDRFRNWATAKDQRYVDWDAAFRNWISNARETSNGTPKPTTKPLHPSDQWMYR
jgi:hypothetical protein